jgi:hypothetical protein
MKELKFAIRFSNTPIMNGLEPFKDVLLNSPIVFFFLEIFL